MEVPLSQTATTPLSLDTALTDTFLTAKEAAQLPSINQHVVYDSNQSPHQEHVPLRKPPTSVATYVPEPLIDSEEAAAIIKVHPKTLQRLARQKLIKGVQIGTHWRFRASDIEAWYQEKLAG
jgi:excisionase family DNA binding protein